MVLGSRPMKCKGSGAKRRAVEKQDEMMYVPILETLKVLLENDAVMTEVKLS